MVCKKLTPLVTTGLHGEVGGLLHRLDRQVPCRVDHDATLTAHPGDNDRPIFVIMAPARLALLTATTRAASQRFLATVWCLPLLARRVREVIRFNGPFQLTMHLIEAFRRAGIGAPIPAEKRQHLDAHGELSGFSGSGSLCVGVEPTRGS